MKKNILAIFFTFSLSSFSNLFAQSGNLDSYFWYDLEFTIQIPYETKVRQFYIKEMDAHAARALSVDFDVDIYIVIKEIGEETPPKLTDMLETLFEPQSTVLEFNLKNRVNFENGPMKGFYLKGTYAEKDAYISIVRDNFETLTIGFIVTYMDEFGHDLALEIVQSASK